MIIVPENNFKPLDEIPLLKNYEYTPDIVLYSSIFDENTLNKIIRLLNNIQIKDIIFFSDNPTVKYGKLDTNPFLGFLEYIKDDIEKITSLSFNSCIIQKNNFKSLKKSRNYTTKIIPSVILGYDTEVEFKNSSKNISKILDIKNGSLLIQRDSVQDYWNIEILNEKDDLPYYTLTFLDIFIEKNNILPKRKIIDGRLSYSLHDIYLSTKQRILLKEKIYKGLEGIHINPNFPEGYRCIAQDGTNKLKKYINLKKHIGSGDWGNVYSACLQSDISCIRKFAVKMARIEEEDLKDPYTETSCAWYEIWMLKDIIRPLIENNICPNLPLYIDTFLCGKCDFLYKGKEQKHPCVITVMELATGDLKNFFSISNFTNDNLYSALFQIMAGLHAIQMRGQIFINDVKAANILYYTVKPGGYWHYIINDIDFYVPNYGYMFVLNDFGVSNLYNPNFQLYPNKNKTTFNLGSRFAINMNEQFSPIEAAVEVVNNSLQKTNEVKWQNKDGTSFFSKGATYSIDRKTGQVIISRTKLTPIQKSYLFSKGISTNPKTWDFFEHPYIVPPFEFYNDVQDALRMFVGGKRASQRGIHKIYINISKSFKDTIKPYLGLARGHRKLSKKDVDSNDIFRVFSLETYHVLAGSFITKFFTKTVDYTKKQKGRKISSFNMKF